MFDVWTIATYHPHFKVTHHHGHYFTFGDAEAALHARLAAGPATGEQAYVRQLTDLEVAGMPNDAWHDLLDAWHAHNA